MLIFSILNITSCSKCSTSKENYFPQSNKILRNTIKSSAYKLKIINELSKNNLNCNQANYFETLNNNHFDFLILHDTIKQLHVRKLKESIEEKSKEYYSFHPTIINYHGTPKDGDLK